MDCIWEVFGCLWMIFLFFAAVATALVVFKLAGFAIAWYWIVASMVPDIAMFAGYLYLL